MSTPHAVARHAGIDADRHAATKASDIDWQKMTGTSTLSLATYLVERTLLACKEPNSEKAAMVKAVVSLLEELDPQNPLEGMLISQMVVCHLRGLNLMKASPLNDTSMSYALKFQRIFIQQLAALQKLRGKSCQSVRVEHIHIQDANQVMVGAVNP